MSFDDGTSSEVDLQNHLKGRVFEPLKTPAFFTQFSSNVSDDPELETLVWANGVDFAPALFQKNVCTVTNEKLKLY